MVVTPPVEYIDPVTDEGQGPIVCESDVVDIEAATARDAVAIGVRLMLCGRVNGWRYHYCLNQRADGLSPYAGVYAIEIYVPPEAQEPSDG